MVLQVAGETGASQSSLLRQLSELETGATLVSRAQHHFRFVPHQLLSAALHFVQKSLPDKQLEEHSERFGALQLRIQTVYNQVRVVEVGCAEKRCKTAPAKRS